MKSEEVGCTYKEVYLGVAATKALNQANVSDAEKI